MKIKFNKSFKWWVAYLSLALSAMILCAAVIVMFNQPTSKYANADRPYVTLEKPIASKSNGKLEVIEFFWYGCPTCRELEPLIKEWTSTLPHNVSFQRVHVVWTGRSDVAEHAKIFYALQSMGVLENHHQKIFDAIQKDGIELRQPTSMSKLLEDNGIDSKIFFSFYGKPGDVSQPVESLQKITKLYDVDAVPLFVGNGKYVTGLHMNNGNPKKLFTQINSLLKSESDR